MTLSRKHWCTIIARVLALVILAFPSPVFSSSFHPVNASTTNNNGDFLLSASPPSLSLNNLYGSFWVLLNSTGGFSGTVSLTVDVSPSQDVSVSVSPSSVSVPVSGVSPLVAFLPDANADGQYTVTVVAKSSNGLIHSINVPVNVDFGPNILMISSTSSLSIGVGSSATSTITVTSRKNFSGTVTLSTGAKAEVVNGPNGTLLPFALVVSNSGSVSTTLTVATTIDTPPGKYDIIVSSTGTRFPHSLVIHVTVSIASNNPSFVIWPVVSRLRLVANSTDYSRIMARRFNQYSGSIILTGYSSSSATGLQVSGTNVIISPPHNVSSGLLTIVASPSMPDGNYTVNITGTSNDGSIVRHTSITVEITHLPIVNVNIDPGYVRVDRQGSSRLLILVHSLNRYNNTIYVSDPSVASNNGGLGILNYGSLGQVNPDSDAVTSLDIVATNTTLAGTYPVSIRVQLLHPSIERQYNPVTLLFFVDVIVPTYPVLGFLFADVLPDKTGSVAQGSSVNFTVVPVATLHSYSKLETSIGPFPHNNDPNVHVVTVTAPLTTPVGKYDVWLVGTDWDDTSTTIQLQVTVAPFEIQIVPEWLNAATWQGKDATGTVIVKSLSGYSGRVDLGVKLEPFAHLSATVSPTMVNLSPGHESANATLTVHALVPDSLFGPGGGTQYTVTVEGLFQSPKDGTLSYDKSVKVEYQVPLASGPFECSFCNLGPWQTGILLAILGLIVGSIAFGIYRRRRRERAFGRDQWKETPTEPVSPEKSEPQPYKIPGL